MEASVTRPSSEFGMRNFLEISSSSCIGFNSHESDCSIRISRFIIMLQLIVQCG